MKKGVTVFLVLVISATILLFLYFIYSKIDEEVQTDYPKKYEEYIADIDTPAKKWLNGHLGIFFRFRYFGNINWLVFPLLIFFLLTIRMRKRWQIALFFVYAVSALSLSIRGFFWWRYQFTLHLFTIAVIMLLAWEFLRNKNSITRVSALFLVGCLTFFSVFRYFDDYKFQWTNKIGMLDEDYPNEVLKYVDDLEYDGVEPKFLICSVSHIFFYYMNKHAFPYYSPELNERLTRLDRQSLHHILKNVWKVRYIFSDWIFEEENKQESIGEILDLDCKKIISDRGYQLYLLRNMLFESDVEAKSSFEYNVWDSTTIRPEDTSPELGIQGIRGEFNFEFKKSEGRNELTVYNEKKGENGERIIQFGYTLNNDTIEANSLHSKYLYFYAEVNIPQHLINKDNFIFIQDFDGKWERTQKNFAAPRWRSYVVLKKIRPKSSTIGVGFKFQFQSEKDNLQIRNVKIYFLDQLL